jgi:5-methylcytosine-specific restriction endonuclease McrA
MSLDTERLANSFQRNAIYNRDNGNCHYCGIELIFKGFHVDHKKPWSKGGQTTLDNLVASCYMCNGAKSNMDYQKFKILLEIKGLDWRRRCYFATRAKFAKV